MGKSQDAEIKEFTLQFSQLLQKLLRGEFHERLWWKALWLYPLMIGWPGDLVSVYCFHQIVGIRPSWQNPNPFKQT